MTSAIAELNAAVRRARIRAAVAGVKAPPSAPRVTIRTVEPDLDMAEVAAKHNAAMRRIETRRLLRFTDADGREVTCGWCRSATPEDGSPFCGDCRWTS